MKSKLEITIPLVVLFLVLASMMYPKAWLVILSTLALIAYVLWDWYESHNRWMLWAAAFFIVLLVVRLCG